MDPGLDGGGEEGKGEAGDPEPVRNELREVHAEDEGSKGEWVKEWVKGRWVKGAIHGVEWLEKGSEAVGGRDSGSEADEGYGGRRHRGGGCQSGIPEGSLDSFVKVGVQSGEDCGSSRRDGV